MNRTLLVLLTLLVGQAMAMQPMELTIDNEQAMPTDTTEKKVVIPIQGQEREIPARFIPLIGTLAVLSKEGTPLHMSPITLVSLDTWQLIEDQLEQVYAITQGNQQGRDEIIADYRQLDKKTHLMKFIDLIRTVDFLDIPLLKGITLEVAQNKLTFTEIFLLPEHVRNGIIKGKALSLAGPIPGREQVACRGHETFVLSVCVAPDGKIVLGSRDGTVRLWDMNGHQFAVCRHEGSVHSVCVTPDGKIVSGSEDNTVRISVKNGQQLAVRRDHEGFVWSVCVTHDDKIVLGFWDGTVRVWDMNGKELAVCRGHEGAVNSVCVSSDGKIVSGSEDETLRIWDMKGQELAVCRGHFSSVMSVCVTPDGKIVSGSDSRDCTMRIWNMNGKELAVCRGHKGSILSVCVTHDGKIVSGSWDKTIRVWSMEGRELAVCRGHESEVWSVCVTPDGKIVSGSKDKTLRIWDISLLDRLSVMSKKQALAICTLLQSATCENQEQKEHFWKEIAKTLEELITESK